MVLDYTDVTMKLPDWTKIGLWIVLGLVIGLVLGGGAGWMSGQRSVDELQMTKTQQATAIAGYQSEIASQSAQVRALNDQVAGYQDYLVSHTEQTVEAKYLTGYQVPITGKQPPYTNAAAMPEAARTYRGGVHEGMDFSAAQGTPVVAVGAGQIVRADTDYIEPSLASLRALSTLTEQLHFTPDNILDTFRGRQIWLLLPGNVIIRYCHLSSSKVTVGQKVAAGEVLGATGSSGTIDGAKHLHFEIRVGNTYLGSGQPYATMVSEVKRFFSSQQ